MRNSLPLIGLAGVLTIAGCQSTRGGDREDEDTTISLSEVPAPVRTAFEKMHPNATVHEVERETHADGTSHYEFAFTQDGKRREVELDDKGAVAPEDED